ncbi:lipopolysaccharide biosynthesis protein, LPS:glycosyltransferase [Leptolyngbya sp. NIES-3755]|nr:lipopolysaccharide biosynthesis protein, LPS:glycosyltransferase [Leptolyngbya sp. NIES-3755]
MSDCIRVFIGSGEASLVERKVAIYSLKKQTQHDLDIYVLNGTHNAIERNDQAPVPAPMSLDIKYRNVTEFSLYRYLIPQICEFQGRAIYIDSDTVCLSDIRELFETDLAGSDFLAKRESTGVWGLSVMLIDCDRCRFNLEKYCDEIDQGLYSYTDFNQMNSRFLEYHHFSIAELDPNWNQFDFCDSQTKLIHYTNLYTQPWKAQNHPFGELWFQYFREALEAGILTERDIELSILRSYVRPDIRQGNLTKKSLRSRIKELLR